jgi:glucokinase
MSDKLAVGIDLGGTNCSAALVRDNGEIVKHVRRTSDPARGPEVVLESLAEMVHELIQQQDISRDDIVGLGIGSPGPLSHRDGIVFRSANLPGWENVRVRRGLLERTGLPTILDNDANAAALAEYWVGAGKGVRQLVVLTLGTGIGSGVIINGEILRGYFENAAELGHTIVAARGRPCSCGQCGCLEQYAAPGGLARHCIERLRAGEQSSLAEVLKTEGGFGSRAIAEAAQQGDRLAQELWDEACFYLAVGCVNIQHAFNPQMLVLAGGMTKAGDFLLSRVREHFERMHWQLHNDAPEITISTLGNDAGVIGAAGLAWQAREGV